MRRNLRGAGGIRVCVGAQAKFVPMSSRFTEPGILEGLRLVE